MSTKELGLYFKSIREGLGYSTRDISKLCEISQSYISLMENGKRKPSPIILKKLSEIYFLDYFDLLEKAGYNDLIKSLRIDQNIDDNYINYVSEDDAMFPLLDIGDVAVVYKQSTIDNPPPGSSVAGVYLIKLDGKTTIRRIIESTDKSSYTLEGTNPSYRVITVKKEDMYSIVSIIGKVIKAENTSAFKF